MLKVTKLSATILIFYVLFYLQVWGDNHLILYGSAMVVVLSMAIYCILNGSLKYTNVPYGIWNNLILAVYAVVTGFFIDVDTMSIISSTITLFAYAVVCIAICYTATEEGSFEWVLKILVALALICSVYTLFFGAEWVGYGITMSKTNNPHNLAGVLNLGIFATAYLMRNKERKFSFVSVLLMILFILVTIRCGSRKYLVANVLIVAVSAWATLKDGWKSGDTNQRIITVILLFVFVAIGYYITQNVFMSSDSYNRLNSNMDEGNQNRIWMYEKAWEIFLDHPLFGGGFDQFKYWSGTGGYSHSTYAEALADIGFMGCLLYFLPIMAAFYRILHRALHSEKSYGSYVLLAFCVLEFFIGVGQIFFIEFHHFLVWSILFFYSQKTDQSQTDIQPISTYGRACRYIR